MYCKNCGKQIEDDSKFCKHCGTQVENAPVEKSPKSIKTLYEKFLSLSSKWQIIILSYGFWVIGWICAVIIVGMEGTSSDYGETMFMAFLAIFVLPFVIFTIIHLRKLHIKKKTSTPSQEVTKADTPISTPDTEQARNDTKASKLELGKEVERFTLQEFALLYGKMQVKTYQLGDGSIKSYCTFTNKGVETKVYFDDKLGTLSATEISARKSSLCVIEYEEKQYVLSNAL